ncbi:MAG: tRNA (N6-isopentenyl adenosine(37)-C2)-methylthiotransferase MiaB [Alphaproteobacteria bacterium]|nr:tRNA (N6-isopentenyl adenosine(37)-C2)-methylthiotransferase MiaB [Alphaproteobacteria bacterium]
MSKKLYIKTYGCQMNVYDSEKMATLLGPLGYTTTDVPDDADVAIINTCHIREKAEQKVFSDLGRLNLVQKRRLLEGKDTIIAVGGCVAQAEGDHILKQAPYVSMVFGPQTYHRLPEMLTQLLRSKGQNLKIVDTDFPIESKFDHLPQQGESALSAFLTIQEGCDKFCTFCCVPYTRGAETSRPVASILEEARHLVSIGAKDITLLGQNVNAYHGSSHEKKEWGLGRLFYALAEIDGLERLRYMTSHPRDVDNELIHAHRDIPKLMPFLHLPVQSGSDGILASMNRKHTVDDYLKIIDQFRDVRPDMAFSSDFIVGFPGETDADHKKTLELVERVGYAQSYSFTYSIRPGTPAGVYDLQVPEDVKDRRLQELQALIFKQQMDFNKSCIGMSLPVLFDKDGRQEGQLIGRSPYMQSVYVDAATRHKGEISLVKIEKAFQNSLTGHIETVEHVLPCANDKGEGASQSVSARA